MRPHSHMQKMAVYGGFAPTIERFETLPDGSGGLRCVPSNKKLPSAENFKIENLVRGKLPIQQVDTKVIDSGDFGAMVDFVNNSEQLNANKGE